ncbi:energy transducer TonB [Pontibacter kalidii]|uniref:energy transducer TonB n=1 Tax=Pontibacter kalidii TaxID=2592049 RepID=UPI00225A7484|nr:energy transducer TonB [Pontibacter kalidii]
MRIVLAAVLMALLSVAGQQAVAQVRYLSKSGVKEVPAAEAHFFEVKEENATGGGTLTRYLTADSSKVSLYTYSDLDGGEYKTGVKEGPYYEWHRNGNLKIEGNYSHNKLHGEYRAWYEGGQLYYKRLYEKGMEEDTLKAYYESGKLRRVEMYDSGEMVSGKLYSEAGKEVVFFPMTQLPSFPGGEYDMLRFLASNIKYPKHMQKAGVQGLVVLSFVVQPDGTFKDIEVVKGVHPDGDAEAVRVLQKMPLWKPGLEEGKPTDMHFVLPVRYSIR